jgi:Domain of unknown function (DUF397)
MEHIDNPCWRKSSYSGNGGNCVEVASNLTGIVAVRDSKNVPGPVLVVSSRAWSEFTQDIKHGEFDLQQQ